MKQKTISYAKPATESELSLWSKHFARSFGVAAVDAAAAISVIDLASRVERVLPRHEEQVLFLLAKCLSFKPVAHKIPGGKGYWDWSVGGVVLVMHKEDEHFEFNLILEG